MKKAAPKLAVIGPQSAHSLRLLSALSPHYRVELWNPNERAVVAFRRERPELVLVLAKGHEMGRKGTLSHGLKTEQRPPLVAIIGTSGLPENPQTFMKTSLLDGMLGFPAEDALLIEWVQRTLAGEFPIAGTPHQKGRIRGAIRRLSGFRASSKDG